MRGSGEIPGMRIMPVHLDNVVTEGNPHGEISVEEVVKTGVLLATLG